MPLGDALCQPSPDIDSWTFLPAPTPLAFRARRQAHETAIHRADAESATEASSRTTSPSGPPTGWTS